MLLAEERYEKILEMLEKDRSVKVSMLTKMFGVSIETIRRDLEHLEKQGLLERVYGGAVLSKISSRQLPFKTREKEHLEEKQEIAEIASRFISEGQSIAVDASTTAFEVVKVLKSKFQRLTVLTNSLHVANELSNMEKYTVILAGGILKNEELSLSGMLTEYAISQFNIDTAFIGVSGISLKDGLTDYMFDQLPIQRKMIEVSQQSIVLAHSNKFDTSSLIKICDIDEINMIITDSKIKPNVLERYQKAGIDIINK